MIAHDQLMSILDRILRLKEEQDTISDDVKEVYAEAKSNGYDKTVLGQVVNHLRKVAKKGATTVAESDALFDLYLTAYQGPSRAHTREATPSHAKAPDNAETRGAPVASVLTAADESASRPSAGGGAGATLQGLDNAGEVRPRVVAAAPPGSAPRQSPATFHQMDEDIPTFLRRAN
jgi:uncharacterized protein (UPF0335 family)